MDIRRITSMELSELSVCLILIVFLTAAFSQDITVPQEPVEVKQGSSTSLWCKLKFDSEKVVPVTWQSPPNFKTRTSNCRTYLPEKYQVSCSDSMNPFGFYNMTIKDVQWADRGEYRCMYTRHKAVVDLQVLVPVTSMNLIHDSNSTADPPFLSKGTNAVLTCKTACANPAPKISWFENDQPFKGGATVNNTDSGCTGDKEGQKRTISTITVQGKYMDKGKKISNISCTAENVIGEPKISKTILISYDGPPGGIVPKDGGSTSKDLNPELDAATGKSVQAGPLTQAEIIGIAAGAGVGLLLILLGVACFFKSRRSASQSEEEDPMNKKPPPPQDV
ncbi:cell adhesion molecule 2-like isoform X4 [Lineus longissimus]|uniref:cell adhesion molecule 2-like isoform X4 n=1 Tax=Lineus longissimus TaxID=88925 RepID=UPI00315D459A